MLLWLNTCMPKTHLTMQNCTIKTTGFIENGSKVQYLKALLVTLKKDIDILSRNFFAFSYCSQGRNINNLRYADDTTLMAESEEEQKSLLMKVKGKSYI